MLLDYSHGLKRRKSLIVHQLSQFDLLARFALRHDTEVLAKSSKMVFQQPRHATFTKPSFRLHSSFAVLFIPLFSGHA